MENSEQPLWRPDRNVVHGQEVTNVEALANPEALDLFRGRVELSSY